jgi:hypothetical protein
VLAYAPGLSDVQSVLATTMGAITSLAAGVTSAAESCPGWSDRA